MNSTELQRGAFQTGLCYCVDVTAQEQQNFGVLLEQLDTNSAGGVWKRFKGKVLASFALSLQELG